MIPTLFFRRLRLLALALLSLAGAARLQAEPAPPTIIIFDGSGSMWGELPGDKAQKLESARAALRDQLEALPADVRVGFMSFGHRRKGNCTDIEVLNPPEAGAKERLLQTLDTLDPKGKGPVTATLKEAQKLLAKEPKANIILIHDGPDNCGLDLCAAAAEIAAQSPSLTIHTVGLGLERPDALRLQCVAKATRGRSFDVIDSTHAAQAITEAFKLANLDQGAPAAKAAPEPVIQPSPAEAADEKPGLRLSASLAENGPPLSAPLIWRIFKDGDDAKPIIERAAATVAEDLPPGKYTVEAVLGLAVARGPAEIGSSGPTKITVPLRAGTLKLSVPGQPSHAPIPEALLTLWRKSDPKQTDTSAGANQPIWLGRGNMNELTVPEGLYQVRLESGLANPVQELKVVAGEETRIGFDLAFGRLSLTASLSEGGPPLPDVSFIVFEDDPDAPQGRREITRTAYSEPTFSLPSGTYYVSAKTGQNEVRQRIAIGKGDVLKQNIVVGLSRLEVSAVLEGGLLPPNTLVVHRVLSVEAEPKELARQTGLDVAFELASGRYRVETTMGSENVKATTDVEMQSGHNAKIGARLQAARISVKSGTPSDVVWEIRDTQNTLILNLKSNDTRAALLAPGRYTLRPAVRGRGGDKILELKPGESRIIDLATP